VGNKKDGGIRLDKSCRLTIKNNIIVNNSFGVHNKDETGTARIYYNNVWGNGRDYVNCNPAEGNISVDPRFVNSKAEDYRLSPNSACRKAGEKGVDIGPQQQIKLPLPKKRIKQKPPPPPAPAPKPKPKPKPPKLEVSYELLGADKDGRVKASQGASLKLKIKNSGGRNAQMVKLDISSSSPDIKPISQELGHITPQEERALQFKLAIAPQALNQEVELKLQISEHRGYNPASQTIRFQLISALTTGILEVNSSPDHAELYLDGERRGITPLTITALSPGLHQLKLKKDSYETELGVQTKAGEKQSLTIQLEQRYGRLEISSQPPGARLYVDGEPAGETPLTIPALSIGEHRLKLTKYTPEAILRHEAPLTINLGTNRVEITRFETITPLANMIHIPAGEFEMGGQPGDENQQPPHRVYLDDFYIDQHEVTNAQYAQFMQATGHKPPALWGDEGFNQPRQPVVGVSWEDAAAYCTWAKKRLPTEAEWEKAARGTTGYLYPWGNDFIYGQANIIVPGDGYKYTAPVGSYPAGASPYGVLDMAGNAAEWCADWYAADYYRHSPGINPPGPESGKYRVVRGGSWNSPSYDVRSTHRWRYYPNIPRSYIGLRCVWQP
jgi:formylglycine-generating enzyme required for sulfatase activity